MCRLRASSQLIGSIWLSVSCLAAYTQLVAATPGIPPRELGPVCTECSVQNILANCWHLLGILCWIWGMEGEALNLYER